MGAIVVTGCVGFTLNAYFLKLLKDSVERLETEIGLLRANQEELKHKKRSITRSKSRESESETEEEFQLALESIPSQSNISTCPDVKCTDLICEVDLLSLCRSLDDKHDDTKLTSEGCVMGLQKLQELNDNMPDCPQLIWRLVRVMFEKTKHMARANKDPKLDLLEALDIARRGVELGPVNSKCHLWYAILLGDTCKYDDTKAKLTKGLEFEKHVKISLELDPYNSTALHLIGRYSYEVSGIKWWEAKIAATLFGSVPKSTYEIALQYFLSADELNSEWVENTIFIVKCLVALGRKNEAKHWLDRINPEKHEVELQSQIDELRTKL